MITRTNYQMVKDLREQYRNHEHVRGILSMEDAKLIRDELQLEERDEIGLRNLRDMIVMMSNRENADETSAFVHMIDTELWNKGFQV